MTQVGQERPRLVVVERLEISTTVDPYLTLPALASYCGHSTRWLRDRLKDADRPIPHFRPPGGRILVRRGEFDLWLSAYRDEGHHKVDAIVSEVLTSLRRA